MKDLVSVIMPSYNTAEFIKESIYSVLNQTHQELELIIVDDCSTDNTDEIVAEIKDDRVKYIKNEKNSGAAISRNRALREAKGKWIAFLDSDDVWLPEKLEKQIAFMKENDYKFTYTDYRIVWDGKRMDPCVFTGPEVVNRKLMYRYCYFSTITVMYDRDAIGLVQIADVKKNNDYAMWLKIIEKANCYRMPGAYSYYYKHDNSISSGSKIKLIKHHYILYRKAMEMGKVKSVLYTVRNLFYGVLKKMKYVEKVDD